ncbi:hemolysin-III related domain-containing protein [Ditylenchus destructor]|uniref:Hemolysin-III related domain-containing protein n=1 Tax=Ditylenchus destructor TaxID=166010 RepID=A0AAD4NH30_9BILA|nr:hemolysin-III related domain-containing protein [Ditylenchus destructor]
MVWVWNGFLYGLSQVNLGVYGLSQDTGHPSLTWKYTGYPRLTWEYTGYPRLTWEYTGYPSIRAIPVYGLSQYTGYPSIRAIPVYGLSQFNLGVYGLSQVNLGVYGLSQVYLGVYGLSQVNLVVYGLSQVYLGVYGLSQYTGYPRLTWEYTGYPSIRAIPVYGLSQYTGYPSIRAIPVYGLSQYTGYPSIRAIPVYGLSQFNLGVYGLSQFNLEVYGLSQEVQRVYICSLVVILAISLCPLLIPFGHAPSNGKSKSSKLIPAVPQRRIGPVHCIYVGLALFGLYPAWHWVELHGGLSSPHVERWLPSLVILFALVGMAFVFYATLIPERFYPGQFDVVGCSHQWWHLLILAAMVYWHWAGIDLLTFYHATSAKTMQGQKEYFETPSGIKSLSNTTHSDRL